MRQVRTGSQPPAAPDRRTLPVLHVHDVTVRFSDATVLEEGMTFHVIPWMWGVDGDKTCGISDTIVITEHGCESFFDLPMDFTVKPSGVDMLNASDDNVSSIKKSKKRFSI